MSLASVLCILTMTVLVLFWDYVGVFDTMGFSIDWRKRNKKSRLYEYEYGWRFEG